MLKNLFKSFWKQIVDANRWVTGKNCFTQFITRMAAWLHLTFFSYVYTIKFYTFYYNVKSTDVWKKGSSNSKNEWLLSSASFTAKLELVFVLTLENAFSWRFHFKATRKSIFVLLKKDTREFQNSLPFERSVCFCVTISGHFEHFRYFEIDFLENEILFQKPGVPFFSWKH